MPFPSALPSHFPGLRPPPQRTSPAASLPHARPSIPSLLHRHGPRWGERGQSRRPAWFGKTTGEGQTEWPTAGPPPPPPPHGSAPNPPMTGEEGAGPWRRPAWGASPWRPGGGWHGRRGEAQRRATLQRGEMGTRAHKHTLAAINVCCKGHEPPKKSFKCMHAFVVPPQRQIFPLVKWPGT